MTPQRQTILHNNMQIGNCLQACVASLLDLSINEVPHFLEEEEWFLAFTDYLYLHGYVFEGQVSLDYLLTEPGVDGYFIVVGESPRNTETNHAVIYFKDKLFFDPHPSNDGITGERLVFLIKKTDTIRMQNPWRLFL